MTVTAAEAVTSALSAIVSASSTVRASSRIRRATTCTGTPPVPASALCRSALKCTDSAPPSAQRATPILPTMPNSVSVSTSRPSASRRLQTNQWSRSGVCQSQVCAVIGPADRPVVAGTSRCTNAEHSDSPSPGSSPAAISRWSPSASSSLRAFSAPISHSANPLPCGDAGHLGTQVGCVRGDRVEDGAADIAHLVVVHAVRVPQTAIGSQRGAYLRTPVAAQLQPAGLGVGAVAGVRANGRGGHHGSVIRCRGTSRSGRRARSTAPRGPRSRG